MDTKTYESKMAEFDTSPMTLWYYGLGVAGEAGEAADKIKKVYRDHININMVRNSGREGNERWIPDSRGIAFDNAKAEGMRAAILLELGDVIWYITRIAGVLGSSLEEVMDLNMIKLSSRKECGVLHGEGDNR